MLSGDKSNEHEFCCDKMKRHILFVRKKELDCNGNPKGSIWYNPQHRRYGLLRYSGNWKNISIGDLYYCPFCGKKLPEELYDSDMDDILQKEYGWTKEYCAQYPRPELPEEFKTDEWWKKRGL